jgi:asparagine synthetase B (glutamine-hydrolysing)
MCGFSLFNFFISNPEHINYFLKFRGPDYTGNLENNGFQFFHYLLHMTGDVIHQPFYNKEADIVCVFNGEIYNYKELHKKMNTKMVFKSDGECIIPMYQKYGAEFTKQLDGEFAICLFDFSKGIYLMSTDTFSCKPLWYAFGNGNDNNNDNDNEQKMGIATYKSCLIRAGIPENCCVRLEPNTTIIGNINDAKKGVFQVTKRFINYQFNLRQHKTTYNDWIQAFIKAVHKRVDNQNYPVFVCLSSGYDSGAICNALNIIGKEYYTYTIIADENMDIVNKRISIGKEGKHLLESNIMNIGINEFIKFKTKLINETEKFQYHTHGKNMVVTDDNASVGMAKICNMASVTGRRIYLSGQGADEITSDYGFGGHKIYHHSSFGGKYPDKLEDILGNCDPADMNQQVWKSFYYGTQQDYLGKEETVSGKYGIEGRYPFLDCELVQEFLSLDVNLKNQIYKAPLHYFMRVTKYPFDVGNKIGFTVGSRFENNTKIKDIDNYNSMNTDIIENKSNGGKGNNGAKIALFTLSAGEKYTDVVHYGLTSKQEYCEKHKECDFILAKQKYHDLEWTGFSWSKLGYVRDLLIEGKYEYIFMCDADVIIMNETFDLSDMITKRFDGTKNIIISSETCFYQDPKKGNITAPSGADFHDIIKQSDVLCAGNMFFKRSQWTIDFINRWLAVDHAKYAPRCEQLPFNEIYYDEETVRENVQIIHNQHLFNSFMTYCYRCWSGGDFLCHSAQWQPDYMKTLYFLFNKLKKSGECNFANQFETKMYSFGNDKVIHLNKYLRFKIYKLTDENGNLKDPSKITTVDLVIEGEWFKYDEKNVFLLFDGQQQWKRLVF